jgi:ABC-type polysaccharide/polyol phosphate transport system ATPase subunit
MTPPVIQFENVSKTFTLSGGRKLLRNYFGLAFREHSAEVFYALKDVSFSVRRGESLAVVGSNGAGKSTLLGLVAGLAPPDAGIVTVNGRVAPLLELGIGFHPELTGAENVQLNAALMGLSRRRTKAAYREIVEFADVGEFIREPLRAYSVGMKLRLAFAVAVHCDPEVLLVDEVLVVGDLSFQAKCMEKIREFQRQGKTLLCVSHAPEMLKTVCDRAIWLEHGKLIRAGPIVEILDAYTASSAEKA